MFGIIGHVSSECSGLAIPKTKVVHRWELGKAFLHTSQQGPALALGLGPNSTGHTEYIRRVVAVLSPDLIGASAYGVRGNGNPSADACSDTSLSSFFPFVFCYRVIIIIIIDMIGFLDMFICSCPKSWPVLAMGMDGR